MVSLKTPFAPRVRSNSSRRKKRVRKCLNGFKLSTHSGSPTPPSLDPEHLYETFCLFPRCWFLPPARCFPAHPSGRERHVGECAHEKLPDARECEREGNSRRRTQTRAVSPGVHDHFSKCTFQHAGADHGDRVQER